MPDIEFWCGVAATLIAETVVVIYATEWLRKKERRDDS